MSNISFRALTLIGVGHELEKVLRRYAGKDGQDGLTPSCISCEHFRESTEECNAANGQRPPARIIAFGCNLYRDKDDIPFDYPLTKT